MPRSNPARWIALLALPLVVGCGKPEARPGRVLLVGIDGASPRVVDPLLDEGRLPNLARVAREGVHGPVHSFPPLLSPIIWNTIATGKIPAKHGITGYVLRDGDGTRRLFRSHDRRTHAVWNIASRAGRPVAVVNWWTTHPAEVVRGVMVSDHAIPAEIEFRRPYGELFSEAAFGEGLSDPERSYGSTASVFPLEWSAEVERLAAEEGNLTSFSNPFRESESLPGWVDAEILGHYFLTDQTAARIALAVERTTSPDLLMVYLSGIDRVSHQLWGTLEPPERYPSEKQPTEEEREAGAAALDTYYAFADALIGLLLDRFGPDDLVLVVSDHGFEAGATGGRAETVTGVHVSPEARDGVIFARGPGIPAGAAAGSVTVKDITPTILAWWGLPVGADMDGGVAGFMTGASPEIIPTHDTEPIERLDDASPAAEEKILEQLRGLGYLE